MQTTQRRLPGAQAVLHEVAHLAVERAVMEGDLARPVGPGVEDRLVPDLGLRAGVGEDQRRPPLLDRGDHLRQQPEPEVPGPGEALDRLRGSASRRGSPWAPRRATSRPAAPRSPSRAASAVSRLPSVAESPQVRKSGRKRRSRARASSVWAPRLFPSSSCHSSTTTRRSSAKSSRGVRAGEEEREALGRGDQGGGELLALAVAHRGRVSPVRRSRVQGMPSSASGARSDGLGVRGQGAQRRQPEDAQGGRRGPPARAEVRFVSLHPFEERASQAA